MACLCGRRAGLLPIVVIAVALLAAACERGWEASRADARRSASKAGNSAQEAVADALGNLTKHELGHSVSPRPGKDYDHSTRGVMSPTTPAYPAGYSPEFRKVLKDRIDK